MNVRTSLVIMYCIVPILIGLLTFEGATSYVMKHTKKNASALIDNQSYRKLLPSVNAQRRTKLTGSNDGSKENSLESVVLAIDTGVRKFMAGKSRPDIVDSIAKSLVDFAKNNVDPIYRTKGREYDLKPEIIHFRSDKPSVMFELNSKSIINVLKDLLQSKLVHKYMDTFSKEAAVIYRTLKYELDKAQKKKDMRV